MKADLIIGKAWRVNTRRNYKKFPWNLYKKHRMKWLIKKLPKITKKQESLERELADWFQLENYAERHR